MSRDKLQFNIPEPRLQIDFAFALGQIRELYLQNALMNAVKTINIANLDRELADIVPAEGLSLLAGQGLRGELLFAVPCVMKANPRLLAYYRLLLGFSQKAFYTSEFGLNRYKIMEEKGVIPNELLCSLKELCSALTLCATTFLKEVGASKFSIALLHDLTLLTLGAQFRGGANNKKGSLGIIKIFEIIRDIVKHAVLEESEKHLRIVNAAGRNVLIEFSSDPDIIIREEMLSGNYRNIIAIEVKAGTDSSNIHNRIGEAEKSHQKARGKEFVECWTFVNVDRIDIGMARRESPSTNRFFRLSQLSDQSSTEYEDFFNRLLSLTGLTLPQQCKKGH